MVCFLRTDEIVGASTGLGVGKAEKDIYGRQIS